MSYRIRVNEQGQLVLQVREWVRDTNPYSYGEREKAVWRDATVEDIPVTDPFRVQQEPGAYLGQQCMATPADMTIIR